MESDLATFTTARELRQKLMKPDAQVHQDTRDFGQDLAELVNRIGREIREATLPMAEVVGRIAESIQQSTKVALAEGDWEKIAGLARAGLGVGLPTEPAADGLAVHSQKEIVNILGSILKIAGVRQLLDHEVVELVIFFVLAMGWWAASRPAAAA